MHICVSRDTLLAACQLAGNVVPKHYFRPALTCVRIDAGNGIILTASDTQIGLRQELEGEVIRPGSALLPVVQTLQILKVSPAEQTEIEVPGSTAVGENEQTVILRFQGSLRGEFRFPQMPVEEFPEWSAIDPFTTLQCQALPLAEAAEQTLFSVAKQDTSGWSLQETVALECDPASECLELVTTDGRRLSASRISCQAVGEKQSWKLPANVIRLLCDLLSDVDRETQLQIRLGKEAAHFVIGPYAVYSALVNGRFPNHRPLLAQVEKKNSKTVTILTEPWISALRQIRAVADKEVRKVLCDFRRNSVVLSTRGQGSGSVELELPDDFQETLCIAFDIAYLLEFLTVAQKLGYQAIVARFSTPEAMAWFGPKFQRETSWDHLLMPMQVQV